MQVEIQYGPAYAIAKVTLAGGEQVKADGGAMLAMSTGTQIETSTQGGLMKGLRRAVLGGESFFMNTFTAPGDGGDILFAPKLPGDVMVLPIEGETVYVQSGAYLAADGGVDIDSHWGGAKTFFSRQGLFMLKVSGQGQVVLGTFGAIHAVDLQPGQSYTVGTGHLVAWSENVGYEVHKVGGWKSTLLSGEGLVCQLTGPGRVYIQTRSEQTLLGWIESSLPHDQNHSS